MQMSDEIIQANKALEDLRDRAQKLKDQNEKLGTILNGNYAYQNIERRLKGTSGTGHSEIRSVLEESAKLARGLLRALDHPGWQTSLMLEEDEKFKKHQRKQKWFLWIQQIIRWILGAFLAVILYSFFVWLSEHFEVVKVPVRDLFPVKQSLVQPNNVTKMPNPK